MSSVFESYQDRREAARRGIETAGGEPLLVNEDFQATTASSRNACLDGVASTDAIVIIIGARGGWRAPSGKLVVEEEYEEALRRKLPILLFVEDIERDDEAQYLVDRLSDYVEGHFRQSFSNTAELETKIAAAIASIISPMKEPEASPSVIQTILENGHAAQFHCNLRLVIGPERVDEVIDPMRLEEDDFQTMVMQIAHDRQVGAFGYDHPKTRKTTANHLLLEQEGRPELLNAQARLEIYSNGVIVFETNISGTRENEQFESRSQLRSNEVLEADVVEALDTGFTFTKHMYDEVDNYNRYSTLRFNAALIGLGNKKLVDQRSIGFISIGHFEIPYLPAFDAPRRITRQELAEPQTVLKRTLHGLRHRQNESSTL